MFQSLDFVEGPLCLDNANKTAPEDGLHFDNFGHLFLQSPQCVFADVLRGSSSLNEVCNDQNSGRQIAVQEIVTGQKHRKMHRNEACTL